MPIQVLDDLTVNKIAAGEVIERPASAVKELLENAADSGATRVEVDFEGGGKLSLKVLDNGSGISSEELPLALQRHATSKICSIDDLTTFRTLGFRGEALASLSSVSELTLQSTQKGARAGAKIISRGGKIEGPMPSPPLDGTQIVLTNLFFNVPARLKFLKSDAGETGAIKKVVKAFALAHPDIAVTLKQNGKVIHHWPVQDFVKRCCQVLDVKTEDTFYLESCDGDRRLQAALVHPRLSLPTLQGLWIFVQNRPVTDKLVQQSVLEAYRHLIMDHQYPQAVISINVPATEVDVNVHPAKAQVKFAQPSSIFKWVNQSIKALLAEKLPPIFENPSMPAAFEPLMGFQPDLVREAVTQYNQRVMVTVPESSRESPPAASEATGPWSGLQVIGQFANTYIIAQSPKALIIVDQHAAHERMLFERLKRGHQVERQMSLVEEFIELSPEMAECLTDSRYTDVFEKAGFELSLRGHSSLVVHSRPGFLVDVSLKPLMERLGEQLLEIGSFGTLNDILGELWASMSCHGAIRAGRVLSPDEMKALLIQMDEFPFSSFCPHGRPVSVPFSLHDLEKLFKRIV